MLGGAVSGQQLYGSFPLLDQTSPNYNPNAFVDNRGVLLPTTSLAQYGGTLAKWFGATEAQLDSMFPELTKFAIRDLGFML